MAADRIQIELDFVRVDEYANGWQQRPLTGWTIVAPLEKLRAKYTSGGSLIFDHYVFHYPQHEPNRITPVDMAAVDQLMSGNLSARHTRWSRIIDASCQQRLQTVLEQVPVGATIEEPRWDTWVSKAVDSLVQEDVQLAIATKLLMVKRPWLVPMYDSALRSAFDDSLDVAGLQQEMRRLLTRNREAVEALRRTVADEFALELSPLRILEQLLWFDWNLTATPDSEGRCHVRGFPEWAFNTKDPGRGVHRVE
ncbi:DUF6308 family protein [Myxococcus stipitatus]|uniref:DUF6308 family protein n=1 Tax=Myxococcus stipitatus TaxID=83455 RepID=UPI001F231AC3|nr:DUF6308 family protein [Myxococcus stipitatus]MCE9667061.1 DUF6308 family protein [Myxococcus stipitatus]